MAEKKHGGPRPGAGRKPGSINRATAEARKRAEEGGVLPLDFMLNHMRDESAPMAERLDMAKAAAPYVHAKLSSVEAKVDADVQQITRIELVAATADDDGED